MKKLSIALLLFGLMGSLSAQVMKNDWLWGGSIKFSSNEVSDIKTTMRYAHIEQAQVSRKAIDVINIFNNKKLTDFDLSLK